MKLTTQNLLEVMQLAVEFETDRGPLRAVDQVSFGLAPGESLAVLGESGSGKTVTALALMRLLDFVRAHVRGTVHFDGVDLLSLAEKDMRARRGRDIAMVFQEPATALNPVRSIGVQMAEVIRRHTDLTRRQAHVHAIDMLGRVGIAAPAERVTDYPHVLSGGIQQRVIIAMALACSPKLLIADEPTTALDVTTQAQVLEQMLRLCEELGTSLVLITHDLAVAAQSCSRTLVMYCGRIVEEAATTRLFKNPRHPYSAGLVASAPRIRDVALERLPLVPGRVPDMLDLPPGCDFAPRCDKASARCLRSAPVLEHTAAGAVACFHPEPEA